MTIFHLLQLAGLVFGVWCGFEFGHRFGVVVGGVGAIVGGYLGLVVGRIPLLTAIKLIQREFRKKTVAELRAMLRDPACLTPNAVLLELGARREDLEQELPVVFEMLKSPLREKRIRGWHALASAFPDRAALLRNYRVDDSPEECQRKIEKLGFTKL